MAIHLGWYGGRKEGMTRVDVQNDMQGTAIDVYMPFGLEDETDLNDYGKIVRDEMIRPLLSGSGIKLILILPTAKIVEQLRNKNYVLVNAIARKYNDKRFDKKVFGYYIEEPDRPLPNGLPRWTRDEVGEIKTRLGIKRPLIVNLRSESDQSAFNDYAQVCDVLAAPDYPIRDRVPAWDKIQNLPTLDMLKKAAPGKFWHVVQAMDRPPSPSYTRQRYNHREPMMPFSPAGTGSYAEFWWLTHRPLLEGAKGALFFIYDRSSDEQHDAARYLADVFARENGHKALDTPDQGNVNLISSSPLDSLLWTCRLYKGSYYLWVMDKLPETHGAVVRAFTLEFEFPTKTAAKFRALQERYHPPQPYIPTQFNGNKVVFTDWLSRGEVKLYRFYMDKSA